MAVMNVIFTTEVSDRDGRIGEITRVILDPRSLAVAHIVVFPDDLSVTPRLGER